MKNETALDWFFDKIKSHFEHDGDLFESVCFTYAIAKQREKKRKKNEPKTDNILFNRHFLLVLIFQEPFKLPHYFSLPALSTRKEMPLSVQHTAPLGGLRARMVPSRWPSSGVQPPLRLLR